jgi:2-polyprenyl-6-methoxyphenol hydroxylase-like FAD-dependent oxidoreductase
VALVKILPPENLIDWKLLWRDPVGKWVSDNGRIALSGDAAHPFLPSSGNGASQAVEDSATIATTLRLAGRGNVKLALKAYETLRHVFLFNIGTDTLDTSVSP